MAILELFWTQSQVFKIFSQAANGEADLSLQHKYNHNGEI